MLLYYNFIENVFFFKYIKKENKKKKERYEMFL